MIHKAFTLAGLILVSFSNGFIYGQVGGMIDSLKKHEEGLELTEGQISLIASTLTLMCLIGFGLAACVTDRVGRRLPFTIFSIPIVINWIMLYYSTEMHHFMTSRIIAGISVGALISLTIFVPSEYTSPTTRAFYLNMVTTAAPAVGTSLGHAIGLVLHWRTVALLAIIPSSLCVVLPYFWLESPHWLASKGEFDKCQEVFRKLHGTKLNTEKELRLILKMERNKLQRANATDSGRTLKRLLIALRQKYFLGLLLMSVFIHAYFAAAGKLMFSTLATVLLKEITETDNVLAYTLFVDGFIVIGSCISCYLITKTSMRTLLFSTGFSANAILVVFSVCYYFKNGERYYNWVIIILLAVYFIIINAGPYPLLEAIFSEMFPLELKVYAFFISGVILISSLTLTILTLPFLVSYLGYHGLFLLNAGIMSVSLGYIWLKLPETKGKTLQEIEMFFKTNNFDVEDELSNENSRALIII